MCLPSISFLRAKEGSNFLRAAKWRKCHPVVCGAIMPCAHRQRIEKAAMLTCNGDEENMYNDAHGILVGNGS